MSLDIYLLGEPTERECSCTCGHEHTRLHKETFFEDSYTHNIVPMAKKAGIYLHLWRPEEVGVRKASQLIQPLTDAIEMMARNENDFTALNPKNGWGSYETFLPWLRRLLDACKEHPDANVLASP